MGVLGIIVYQATIPLWKVHTLIPSALEQSSKKSDNKALADELADVLFVIICLANQTGINLTEALEKNLAKKTNRDNDRHQNNPKLA